MNTENKWFTIEVEFEGNPLHLRGPVYQNVWAYKKDYSKLVCITHNLDSVTDKGLPTSEYNLNLFDFDNEVTELFDEEEEGIIFLVETYGGSRNYWFYTSPKTDYTSKFKILESTNKDKRLEMSVHKDENWDFIEDYPFELYEK